jgi:hypothetical protein
MAPKKRGRPPGTGRSQILEEDCKAWRARAEAAEQRSTYLSNEVELLKAHKVNSQKAEQRLQVELARIQRLKAIIADLIYRL